VNPNTDQLGSALIGLLAGLPVAAVAVLAVVGFLLGGRGSKGSPFRALAWALLFVFLFAVFGSLIMGVITYVFHPGGASR
jgi:hypothetical protein